MKLILLLLSLNSVLILNSQQYDYVWFLGQNSQTNIEHAGIILDFFNDTLTIHSEFRNAFFQQVNASLCDSSGNIYFSSNGLRVYNGNNEIMENGDSLNPGFFFDIYEDYGYILDQGAIALPYPEHDSLFFLFHKDRVTTEDFSERYSGKYYQTLIDVSQNQGLGKVVQKNIPLLDEWLALGKVTAVQHANGRDWWLPVRKWYSNAYYLLLLDREGVHNTGEQIVGDSIPSASLGQTVFSPDGSKYVQVNRPGRIDDPYYVNIYDFDRCEGVLSNPLHIIHTDSSACLGAAISPNSRFLYVSSWKNVYQYDLWATDIAASRITVAEWDGFADEEIFSNTFYLAQLAPDGRIYINSNNGTKHLHVINEPDSLGLACDVCQHCIELPSWNSFSMPNFPNYRLGHEEGSPCDTLREPPAAAWAYENELLEVAFQNQSAHDIRSYLWTFGDGETDTVAHPIHTYEAEGSYEVCLEVNNPRGEDLYCQIIDVYATDTGQAAGNPFRLLLHPNPSADGHVHLQFPAATNARLELFNILGQRLRQWSPGASETQRQVDLSGLPKGVYLLQWSAPGMAVLMEKVVLE